MASGAHAVKTAFFVNLTISFLKLGAAIFTRSAGMAAEAVHSFADTGNQVLLLLGLKRSGKEANEAHPFGYGKEEYFWSFIVAMLLFVLGSVYSAYEGIHKLLHPEELQHVYINFIILGVSVCLEGYSWLVATRSMGGGSAGELYRGAVESKDANTVVVFVEDTGALLGLAVALAGNALSYITGNPVFDAASSVAVGMLLFVIAIFLANEMRKLLIGERTDNSSINAARRILASHPHVKAVGEIKTMQIGNNVCIIAAAVDFADTLGDKQLEKTMTALKKEIAAAIPQARHVYLQLTGKDLVM
ncbi:MAG: cation diffusion facilitator family transporter [Deltaproteobacteria bacterium]|nr:cation diffusion facilitator family transporter [Deltaproteobacteria bacterium]